MPQSMLVLVMLVIDCLILGPWIIALEIYVLTSAIFAAVHRVEVNVRLDCTCYSRPHFLCALLTHITMHAKHS